MNLARSILFFLWLYGSMAVVTIASLPTMLLPHRFVIGAIRVYARVVLFGLRWIMGIKVEFRGRGHIPDGPLIVAGKHQAMLDVFVPFLLFKDPVVIMKRELLWYPGLGWFALRARMIPIDRGGTARTVKAMLKRARARVLPGAGRQLVIFPEGTRRAPGAEPSYKPAGIRAFYKGLDLPIIPVATNSGLCWHARGIRRTPGTVVYEVLAPIEPGLPQPQMLDTLIERIETASNHLLEEAHARKTPAPIK